MSLRRLALLGGLLMASCGSKEGVDPMPDVAPDSAYQVVEGWPVLPEGVELGSVLGVAVDSQGRVFATHSAGRPSGNQEIIDEPTIFVFDPDSGALLARIGAGLFRYPHGIAIDKEDCIWVTDSEAGRVFKLSPDGEVLLTLGRD
jgi:peptidylamidoglycolate lyase